MDYNEQGGVHGSSPAYAIPQSHVSDTKVRENHVVSQPSVKGLSKKTIQLTVRPKPESDLPHYSGRAKAGKDAKTLAVRSRGVVSHAKTATSIAKKVKAVKQQTPKAFNFADLPQVTAIPATMFTLESAPKRGDSFYFTGVVKGYTTFDRHCVNGEKPAFLELPIASGDCWGGVRVHLLTLKGVTREEKIRFFHKATWGEVLERLYPEHPTGTHHDVDGEADDDPDNYWGFYKVKFELW